MSNKQIAIHPTQKSKTDLDAKVYVSSTIFFWLSDRPDRSGTENTDALIVFATSSGIAGGEGNCFTSVLEKRADAIARPLAPPRERKKFRELMTTARSAFAE